MALAAAVPGGGLLLASPVQAVLRLLELLPSPVFWRAVGNSSARIFGGFLLSCGLALLLAALKAAGRRLMVATSKPEVQAVRILKHFGLAEYFDHICGAPAGSEEGARKVIIIRQALRHMDGGDSSAVMVGDRRHDVAGAKENGLPCIGVLYGYGGREELEAAGAAVIAEDVGALKECLL